MKVNVWDMISTVCGIIVVGLSDLITKLNNNHMVHTSVVRMRGIYG